jgi:hypothetical protein
MLPVGRTDSGLELETSLPCDSKLRLLLQRFRRTCEFRLTSSEQVLPLALTDWLALLALVRGGLKGAKVLMHLIRHHSTFVV